MLTNDTGAGVENPVTPHTRWTPATLTAVLCALVALAAAAVATMPGSDAARSMMNAALGVLAAVGVWIAVRSSRGRNGKLLALALACALGSAVALVVLRVAA